MIKLGPKSNRHFSIFDQKCEKDVRKKLGGKKEHSIRRQCFISREFNNTASQQFCCAQTYSNFSSFFFSFSRDFLYCKIQRNRNTKKMLTTSFLKIFWDCDLLLLLHHYYWWCCWWLMAHASGEKTNSFMICIIALVLFLHSQVEDKDSFPFPFQNWNSFDTIVTW